MATTNKILQYFLNLLIAIDCMANAIAGGDPHHTISYRVGTRWRNSFMCKFINALFGHDHCQDVAQNGDIGKAVLK